MNAEIFHIYCYVQRLPDSITKIIPTGAAQTICIYYILELIKDCIG